MKIIILGLVAYALLVSTSVAAAEFKDFAGTKCKNSEIITVTEIAKLGFPSGPMKGYISVTVILQNGETVATPIPSDLAKKIKVGDRACKATFLDED
jgi:hypothetical protein